MFIVYTVMIISRFWAKLVRGQVGQGPSWLGAKMSSYHFYVFCKGQGTEWGYVFGMLKFFNSFGCA